MKGEDEEVVRWPLVERRTEVVRVESPRVGVSTFVLKDESPPRQALAGCLLQLDRSGGQRSGSATCSDQMDLVRA